MWKEVCKSLKSLEATRKGHTFHIPSLGMEAQRESIIYVQSWEYKYFGRMENPKKTCMPGKSYDSLSVNF